MLGNTFCLAYGRCAACIFFLFLIAAVFFLGVVTGISFGEENVCFECFRWEWRCWWRGSFITSARAVSVPFACPSASAREGLCPRAFCFVGAPPFPRTSDNCECGRICKGYPRKASRLECFTEAGVLAASVANLTNRFASRKARDHGSATVQPCVHSSTHLSHL